jgi:hypothetical protein
MTENEIIKPAATAITQLSWLAANSTEDCPVSQLQCRCVPERCSPLPPPPNHHHHLCLETKQGTLQVTARAGLQRKGRSWRLQSVGHQPKTSLKKDESLGLLLLQPPHCVHTGGSKLSTKICRLLLWWKITSRNLTPFKVLRKACSTPQHSRYKVMNALYQHQLCRAVPGVSPAAPTVHAAVGLMRLTVQEVTNQK